MTNKEFLEIWFKRVWQDEDLNAIDEMLCPSTHVEGLHEAPQAGPQEFRQFAQALLALLSNMRVGIAHFMEDGDWASALVTIAGTCRASGKYVSTTGQILVRIKDGINVEAYNHVDFIRLYEDLGLLPPATLSHCLSGAELQRA